MDAEDYDLISYVQTQIRDSPKFIEKRLNNGILVSNRTPIITKKDNVIYVPLMYFGLM